MPTAILTTHLTFAMRFPHNRLAISAGESGVWSSQIFRDDDEEGRSGVGARRNLILRSTLSSLERRELLVRVASIVPGGTAADGGGGGGAPPSSADHLYRASFHHNKIARPSYATHENHHLRNG